MENEKLYREMLDMQISSCEILKKPKKSLFKNTKLKSKAVKKTNDVLGKEEKNNPKIAKIKEKKQKPKDGLVFKRGFKVDVVSVQVAVIFALAVTILLTNIFWENSGMNVALKGVFGGEQEVLNYDDFTVYAPTEDATANEEGVMTFNKVGAVYSPCQGVIEKITTNEDSTYQVIIRHSETFTSVISGVNSVYYSIGESVFTSTPVCYTDGKIPVSMTFYDEGEVLTDYVVSGGVVEWEK